MSREILTEFTERIKQGAFPLLDERRRDFVLYSLAKATITPESIVCGVPTKDAAHFFEVEQGDIEAFKKKSEEFFEFFSVEYQCGKKGVTRVNLLYTFRFSVETVVMEFNLEDIKEWLQATKE